jgi:hypothetical protein
MHIKVNEESIQRKIFVREQECIQLRFIEILIVDFFEKL